jgi:predicted MFS family arabinose efflux permease
MGIAFSLGIVLGPIVASWWSVRALFVLCAILVAWAFLYIQSTLEEPRKSPAHTELSIMPGQIWELLHNRRLISVNLGGFITNFFQVGIFVILPLLTVRYRTMSDFWELIVPMVVIGTLIMLWGARQADAGKSKQMTQLAFSFLGLSALTFLIPAYGMLPYPEWNFRVLILSGVLFFAGFSMTQPLLSAGVTKLASENRVGATSGLYNMSQNMGTFFGGLLGGTFMANHANIFLLIMCLLGIWGANTVGRSMNQGGDNKCK